jgi:hypothetical protein
MKGCLAKKDISVFKAIGVQDYSISFANKIIE